jgi:hypothetical protein
MYYYYYYYSVPPDNPAMSRPILQKIIFPPPASNAVHMKRKLFGVIFFSLGFDFMRLKDQREIIHKVWFIKTPAVRAGAC